MRAADDDDRLRAAAFAYLKGLTDRSGGLDRRSELEGFTFEGRPMPLVER